MHFRRAMRRKYPEALKATVLHVFTSSFGLSTKNRRYVYDIGSAISMYIDLHLSPVVEDKREIDPQFRGSERTRGR